MWPKALCKEPPNRPNRPQNHSLSIRLYTQYITDIYSTAISIPSVQTLQGSRLFSQELLETLLLNDHIPYRSQPLPAFLLFF